MRKLKSDTICVVCNIGGVEVVREQSVYGKSYIYCRCPDGVRLSWRFRKRLWDMFGITKASQKKRYVYPYKCDACGETTNSAAILLAGDTGVMHLCHECCAALVDSIQKQDDIARCCQEGDNPTVPITMDNMPCYDYQFGPHRHYGSGTNDVMTIGKALAGGEAYLTCVDAAGCKTTYSLTACPKRLEPEFAIRFPAREEI